MKKKLCIVNLFVLLSSCGDFTTFLNTSFLENFSNSEIITSNPKEEENIIYVDTLFGDNNNSGTKNQPLKTLDKALSFPKREIVILDKVLTTPIVITNISNKVISFLEKDFYLFGNIIISNSFFISISGFYFYNSSIKVYFSSEIKLNRIKFFEKTNSFLLLSSSNVSFSGDSSFNLVIKLIYQNSTFITNIREPVSFIIRELD